MKRFILSTFLLCFSAAAFAEDVDLYQYEKSLFSANCEDGVLRKIFELIKPKHHFLVELGSRDASLDNHTILLRKQGWNGLLLDRAYEDASIKLFKEFITAENLNDILHKFLVPADFDLLSIETTYNSFHIWNALDASYQPAVVVTSFNALHLPHEDRVAKYRPYYCGDESTYYGASILAFYHLGRSKGYSLVYCEKAAKHLFFVRDDLLDKLGVDFKNQNDVSKLYRYPPDSNGAYGGRKPDYKLREYFSSSDFIQNQNKL